MTIEDILKYIVIAQWIFNASAIIIWVRIEVRMASILSLLIRNGLLREKDPVS